MPYDSSDELPPFVRRSLDEHDQEKWRKTYNKSVGKYAEKTEKELGGLTPCQKAQMDAWERVKESPSSRAVKLWASVENIDKDKELIDLRSIADDVATFIDSGGIVHDNHSGVPLGHVWGYELEDYYDEKTGKTYPAISMMMNFHRGRPYLDDAWKDFLNGKQSWSIGANAPVEGYQCDERGCYIKRKVEDIHELSNCQSGANPYANTIWYNGIAKSSDTKDDDHPFLLKAFDAEIYSDCDICRSQMIKKELTDLAEIGGFYVSVHIDKSGDVSVDGDDEEVCSFWEFVDDEDICKSLDYDLMDITYLSDEQIAKSSEPDKYRNDSQRIRGALQDEAEAVNDYEQMAEDADSEEVREVLHHIADDERHHQGELIVILEEDQEEIIEGIEEVIGITKSQFIKGYRDGNIVKKNGRWVQICKMPMHEHPGIVGPHPVDQKHRKDLHGKGSGGGSASYANSFRDIGEGGYDDQKGMSNRAVRAYESGEKPKSKWKKADILEEVENFIEENPDIEVTVDDIRRLPTSWMKNVLLKRSSWHHTSGFYNKTDFYSLNTDILSKMTPKDVETILQSEKEDREYRKTADPNPHTPEKTIAMRGLSEGDEVVYRGMRKDVVGELINGDKGWGLQYEVDDPYDGKKMRTIYFADKGNRVRPEEIYKPGELQRTIESKGLSEGDTIGYSGFGKEVKGELIRENGMWGIEYEESLFGENQTHRHFFGDHILPDEIKRYESQSINKSRFIELYNQGNIVKKNGRWVRTVCTGV